MDVREKKPDNVTKKPVRSDLAIENEQSGDSKEKIFFIRYESGNGSLRFFITLKAKSLWDL